MTKLRITRFFHYPNWLPNCQLPGPCIHHGQLCTRPCRSPERCHQHLWHVWPQPPDSADGPGARYLVVDLVVPKKLVWKSRCIKDYQTRKKNLISVLLAVPLRDHPILSLVAATDSNCCICDLAFQGSDAPGLLQGPGLWHRTNLESPTWATEVNDCSCYLLTEICDFQQRNKEAWIPTQEPTE